MTPGFADQWYQYVTVALREFSHHPVRAMAEEAAIAAALARVGGLSGRRGAALALGAGLLAGERRRARLDSARRLASTADVMSLTAAARVPHLFFGDFAAEADFVRVILRELKPHSVVVECGSGVSTVLIADALAKQGSGRLISFEHDAEYCRRTRSLLEENGLNERVDLVLAPLKKQRILDREVVWYDRGPIGGIPMDAVDLVVVDGPPTVSNNSRWPAGPLFGPLLGPGGRMLLDDGRREPERRAAYSWHWEDPTLRLAWIDTVKGTWVLTKEGPRLTSGSSRAVHRIARALNPRPPGFALSPVHR